MTKPAQAPSAAADAMRAIPPQWPDLAGRMIDDAHGPHHVLPVRVYFEDTDAGQVAYHASYIRWCERGRTAYCEVFAAVNYFGARLDSTLTMSQGDEEIFGSWFGQSSFATYAIASERNAVSRLCW